MQKRIRQTILGLGTFGTGTILLYLNIPPFILILADAVAGIGLLVAAGSITPADLRIGRGKAGPHMALPDTVPAPAGEGKGSAGGLRGSLGRIARSLRPSRAPKPKEGKEEKLEKIDRLLDATLTGQSRRIISLAEGRGQPPEPGPPAAGSPPLEADPFKDLSDATLSTPLLDVGPEMEMPVPPGGEHPAAGGGPEPKGQSTPAVPPPPLEVPGLGGSGEAPHETLTLADASLEPEDLLAALKREALKEKKRDDTSLLRDLRGLKITGRQLLDELDAVVRDLKKK